MTSWTGEWDTTNYDVVDDAAGSPIGLEVELYFTGHGRDAISPVR